METVWELKLKRIKDVQTENSKLKERIKELENEVSEKDNIKDEKQET